jgi:hypothetical protein
MPAHIDAPPGRGGNLPPCERSTRSLSRHRCAPPPRCPARDINGTRGTVRIGEPASINGPKFAGYAASPQSFRGLPSKGAAPSGAIRAGMGAGLPGTQAPWADTSPLLSLIASNQNGGKS